MKTMDDKGNKLKSPLSLIYKGSYILYDGYALINFRDKDYWGYFDIGYDMKNKKLVDDYGLDW